MKYTKNDVFWNTPNIENCFYAGFIAADGYVEHDYRRGYSLQLKVKSSDGEILERLKSALKYTGRIYDLNINSGENQKRLMIFGAKQYLEDLEKHFNIKRAKSLTLMPPNIENINLIKSYLCGYLEGDGCITYDGKLVVVDFCTSKYFGEWLLNFIYTLLNIKGYIGYQNGIYHVKFKGKKARILLDWMISNPIRVLNRKWRKYEYTII